mmetsp:Transcript_27002/g.63392  ORF Transcript_27002/g.63392 Transcript_27002/m.63392 type:complete len:92 (-) Transcript_27002:53-328(-)
MLGLFMAALGFVVFFEVATDFEKKEKRLPCFNDFDFFAGGAMVDIVGFVFEIYVAGSSWIAEAQRRNIVVSCPVVLPGNMMKKQVRIGPLY